MMITVAESAVAPARDRGVRVSVVPTEASAPGLGAALEEHLDSAHPGVEVVRYDGGQDRCPLLVGVE
jgi:uroporphyrinogen-III synthase